MLETNFNFFSNLTFINEKVVFFFLFNSSLAYEKYSTQCLNAVDGQDLLVNFSDCPCYREDLP